MLVLESPNGIYFLLVITEKIETRPKLEFPFAFFFGDFNFLKITFHFLFGVPWDLG